MKHRLLSILSVLLMTLTANAQHEYVDLGLPSGTLWATCNVGADSPEEFGDYYAWGETATKKKYSWDSYAFSKGEQEMSRYCLQSENAYNGNTDNLNTLLPMDDAATVKWGGEWQMPTKGQMEELIDNRYTTLEKTTLNGVSGYKITSKSNAGSIFLPAAGCHYDLVYGSGSKGEYWSRSLDTSNSLCACKLTLYSGETKMTEDIERVYGLPVRPVLVKKIRSNTEYVDLGLPSGTLWATCNIGADNPEDNGDYYAWGETAPKSRYSIENYTGSGYDGSEGSPKELLPEDDAASVNWGSEWQTPNVRQFKELQDERYTTTEWTTVNGVGGYKITSKRNGNSIFLPAGRILGTNLYESESCFYWSRTTVDSKAANYMLIAADRTGCRYSSRTYGLTIRPVRVLEEKEHEYVDLGLPSGTLWATCNVGAYIPEEYGDYFHWGETEPVSVYTSYSFTDNPTELLPENDAAAVNWGVDWRMPSLAQIEELINENYTTAELTTLNGVNGCKITSKSNGNSIFLPAAGNGNSSGNFGWYWSSSINTSSKQNAWILLFESGQIRKYSVQRGSSVCVRPVCLPKEVYTEFDESTGTLTYYYDGRRSTRTGKTEAYIPIGGNYDETRFNDYNEKVTKAVIDPSMKKAPLTSTRNMFYGGGYVDYVSSVGWTIVSYPLPNLTSIEGLENLNTENARDMIYMFNGCKKLQTLDLSSFNIGNVTDMSYMFYGCKALTTICCNGDWSTSDARSEDMFFGCESLVGGKGTPWDSSVIDKTYARPDRGTSKPGYFTATAITGDLNGDGKVDIADAVTVLNIMAAGEYNTEADVNGDKKVDIADFVTILNIMAAQ